MIYIVYCNISHVYLTISAENVFVFTSELVDHLYNMSNASMVQPEPAILPPCITLRKGCTLAQAGHHAKHPPRTSFAGHHRTQIANRDVNRLDGYLVLHEATVDIHDNSKGNCPLTDPDIQKNVRTQAGIYAVYVYRCLYIVYLDM